MFRFRRLLLQQSTPRVRETKRARLSRPESQSHLIEGVIFGMSLKNILLVSRVGSSKKQSLGAIRHILLFLHPAACALSVTNGTDRDHLVNGLAAHRIARRQRAVMHDSREGQATRTYLGRAGLKDVAFGATAAVICTHLLLRRLGLEAGIVATGMSVCLSRLNHLLRSWTVLSGPHTAELNHNSLYAEIRAVSRAQAAVIAATRAAGEQELTSDETLELQFQCIRTVVWYGDISKDSTHIDLRQVDPSQLNKSQHSTAPLGAFLTDGVTPSQDRSSSSPSSSASFVSLPDWKWIDGLANE